MSSRSQFLEAFGNKATTIKRLRAGASNRSDVGGVLQTNHIHIAVADQGAVTATLGPLKASPATAKAKVKFVLATDGDTFEAEDVESGETVACDFAAFPDHFGFFLPLAGITTVRQLRESSFDIRATSRLNRLYRTLLEENPAWDVGERRADMNHFMARLIFCFFAEDTDIFHRSHPFTGTIETMSDRGFVEHARGDRRAISGDEHTRRGSRVGGRRAVGATISLCQRRPILRQSRRAALQPDRALLPPPHRRSRLDEDQPGHLRVDDPGRCR